MSVSGSTQLSDTNCPFLISPVRHRNWRSSISLAFKNLLRACKSFLVPLRQETRTIWNRRLKGGFATMDFYGQSVFLHFQAAEQLTSKPTNANYVYRRTLRASCRVS